MNRTLVGRADIHVRCHSVLRRTNYFQRSVDRSKEHITTNWSTILYFDPFLHHFWPLIEKKKKPMISIFFLKLRFKFSSAKIDFLNQVIFESCSQHNFVEHNKQGWWSGHSISDVPFRYHSSILVSYILHIHEETRTRCPKLFHYHFLVFWLLRWTPLFMSDHDSTRARWLVLWYDFIHIYWTMYFYSSSSFFKMKCRGILPLMFLRMVLLICSEILKTGWRVSHCT